MKLSKFEKRIGYRFRSKALLKTAFTHSSYAHEQKTELISDNERLEFLGDAVLEIVISEFLFKRFPEMPEGELTRFRAGLVCESVLVKKARELQIGEFLLLGKGEELTGGRNRDSILADAFEAVTGAVFIDGGARHAKKFILKILSGNAEQIRDIYKMCDNKTYLQEIIQRTSKAPVRYKIVGETGPDHEKTFTAEAMHQNKVLGRGRGRSKKEAEQNAALESLKRYT